MEKEQKKLSTGVVVLIITLVVALITVSTILAYKILNEEETNKPLTEVNNEQKEVVENNTEDKGEVKEESTKKEEKDEEKENGEREQLTSKELTDLILLFNEHGTNEFIWSRYPSIEGIIRSKHILQGVCRSYGNVEYITKEEAEEQNIKMPIEGGVYKINIREIVWFYSDMTGVELEESEIEDIILNDEYTKDMYNEETKELYKYGPTDTSYVTLYIESSYKIGDDYYLVLSDGYDELETIKVHMKKKQYEYYDKFVFESIEFIKENNNEE